MRVALISYEFPPAVAIGGIGTYALNAATMLAAHGDDLHVFAAGSDTGHEPATPGIVVQRIEATDRAAFASALVPFLVAAHRKKPFDVIEAPEIGPEGVPAFEAVPTAGRVLKLHTPSYLVGKVGVGDPTFWERARFLLGALRRGRWATLESTRSYDPTKDPECRGAEIADEIAAPSQSIADIVGKEWGIPAGRLHTYPYPFTPSAELLDLPLPKRAQTIGFLGRLEPRKGVIEMARAIPKILREFPELTFRFIGPSLPQRGGDTQTWIQHHLASYRDRLEFTGGVRPADIPAELGRCDLIVLPSRWENFPYACWESLAAGRVVVGSAAGGMAEIIEPGVSGLLVDPRSPTDIARVILGIVRSPEQVSRLAAAGRERVLTALASANILPLQHASYQRAIAQAARRNTSAC